MLGADEPAPAKFHGTDVTGYQLDYGFALKDTAGRELKIADFKGKVVYFFFGFTQCPVICPTALTRAAEIKRLLGADGEKLQVVFVTIDPERDTPEVLRSYAAAFDPSFLGLSTDPEKLKALSRSFKFTYSKVQTGSSYTMDHSTASYVFDPSGKIRLILRHEAPAADCADDIRKLLQEKTN
ncbi:SCO family protein [Luteolibacter sp. Populi]|uniref:SCO family protein n=1 Tax=Luteolibacter sp. Populi TaxID=3230487 RepID=UPI0034650DA8